MDSAAERDSGAKAECDSDSADSIENIFPDMTIILTGYSSSVKFGHENLLLGEKQMNFENAEASSITPLQKKISEYCVSVINMIDLHETEHVDHAIGQVVTENEIQAFIFVVRLGQLTDSDKTGLEWIQRVFGDKVLQFVLILFTYETEEESDTIIDDLKKNPVLEKILEKCGGRYQTCNTQMNNQSEMRDLMKKIEDLCKENQQQSYTGEMFNTAARKRKELETQRDSPCQSGQTSEIDPNAKVNFILLGTKQAGKSASGNTILGREAFESKKSSKSVTRDVAVESGAVNGFPVTVYDTPGLSDRGTSEEEIQQMISHKVLHECKSGHCVFLLVIRANRFTEEDQRAVEKIEKILGEKYLKKTWILFTRGDELEEENTAIQQFIEDNEQLKTLIQKYEQRYYVFNNKERGSSDQVRLLLAGTLQSFGAVERKNNRSPTGDRPNMSDMRIVLLGKSVSENNRVRNSILECAAIDSDELQQQSQRIRGRVKDRDLVLINSPHLLQPHLSLHQIIQTFRECVRLSAPGPHVFIIVVQYKDFTEVDKYRVTTVLKEFSEEAMKRTIVITTDDEPFGSRVSSMLSNNTVHQLVKECGGGRLQLEESKLGWPSGVLKRVDEILKKNQEQYLTGEQFHVEGTPEENSEERLKTKSDEKSDLNLVLCGNDATLKVVVSKLLQRKKASSSGERADSEVCVKREEKISGRQLSVVELPALSRLSEEEVMRQTLLSVTLCHPGVHAFICLVSVGPLNNDEKSEIEKILKMFDSKEHFILLFTSDLSDEEFAMDFVKHSPDSQSLISRCGGQYRLMGLKEPENSRQIPDLLDYIKNMKTEPYSPQMYVKAQENRVRRELEEQHQNKLSEMENKIKELEEKNQSEGAECSDDLGNLRIVLIGKTGSGKSATGNTILGGTDFVSKARSDSVTTVCEKGVGEVDGRSVAVVDTPGLFDTTLTNEHVAEEIVKCVSLSSPGPHVFIIVLSLGRITKEETDTLDLIKKIFGPKSAQFSIVLFTRGDDLQGESIEDYVRESNSAELKKLIRDCGDRFMVFNNKEIQDRTQVIQLIKMIEEMKNTNQGRYFTNRMFEEAEMNIKKRMEEIMKEREREIETQQEELRVKYESETEELKKRLEEEKIKADEERKQSENEFREKEEKLIKEFEEKHKTEQQKREMEKQKLLEEEKQKKEAYQQKIEEMKREIEKQRSDYEKQRKQREEEDRKREEKYRGDQEKMRNELQMLQIKQEEEIKKRDFKEQKRIEQEEKERQEWIKKIKGAENERKEIQEGIKRQQREWEDDKKQQMREREEEERKRKEKHEEQLREKQEELEKMRKRFEREREEERQKMEEERQKQIKEREEKEREYEKKKHEKIRYYEQLEQERKEEWERRKQEDEERREEERKTWKKMIEDLKQEQEEEMKTRERKEEERKEREEKERNEMKKDYEERMKKMKKTLEDEARKQAEESNYFKQKNEHLHQILGENQKEHELLKELHQRLKEQNEKEINDLKEYVRQLCQSLHLQKEKEINEFKHRAEALNDLLKEQKGEKIKALQQEVQKLSQSLQDQNGDRIQELQAETEKLCKNLQEKKEQHLKKLQEEAEEKAKKSGKGCVIL